MIFSTNRKIEILKILFHQNFSSDGKSITLSVIDLVKGLIVSTSEAEFTHRSRTSFLQSNIFEKNRGFSPALHIEKWQPI